MQVRSVQLLIGDFFVALAVRFGALLVWRGGVFILGVVLHVTKDHRVA